MTRATLRPAPFAIPPAPVARSRAATVSVVRSYDRTLDGIAWRSDQMTTYQVPRADTAADVFDVIGAEL